MTDQELRGIVVETFRGIKELKDSQVRTDAQLAKTDAQLAETDALVKRIAKMVGGISNNQGDVAEEFFYNTLSQKQTLAGIQYDYIDYNWRHSIGTLKDEFDIVMVNGEDIALIEVKYKAHDTDIEKLISKKVQNFKALYPMYANYNIHPALATFHINEELKERALEEGLIVIQRKGDTIESFVKAA